MSIKFSRSTIIFAASLLVLGMLVALGLFAAKTLTMRTAHRAVDRDKLQSSQLTEAELPSGKVLSARVPQGKSLAPAHGFRANILMYHHVGALPEGADAMRRDLTVSTEDFEAQVAWLSQNGYASVTLAQVDAAARRLHVMPKKPVVFTFDDGYDDVFLNAVPILKKYNMVGSFAIVPGFLGAPGYATWQDVETAHRDGMEMISHTENHFDGSSAKFDAVYIKSNLEQSLAELDAHLGAVPRVLVYPYGHYTDEYVRIAREVGFTLALTTHFGFYVDLDDPMHTPRVRVHGGETLERFVEILTGVKKVARK